MQSEVEVVPEDGLQYIQCVLMVTRVFSDISFDPEQNQYISFDPEQNQ
jgi:hypothetical protein